MKRVLITGSNGLVGQSVIKAMADLPGYIAFGSSLSHNQVAGLSPDSFFAADLSAPGSITRVVQELRPEVIVHCGALTQVDACEANPHLCDLINIEGTREVARASESVGAHFIYLSTDFVFDGEGGPYSEEDVPNPVSTYGWSKLQGEFITLSLRCPKTIVRTILVYGVAPAMNRTNLVLWVRNSLTEGKPIRVVDDQFRMPTLSDDLALGISRIIQLEKEGIYHLSGSEMTSVHDFALKTARFFALDETLISPIRSQELNQPGRRPRSTGFILNKAREDLEYSPRNLDQGLNVVRNLLDSI